MADLPILSNGHWVIEGFAQRMTTREWKEVLLQDRDKIFFKGNARQLVAKRLGVGVVEISKNLR